MGNFWFCVRHRQVETDDSLCPSIDRLGPYASEADAALALEKAEARNEEWDNDPRWKDD